MKRWVVRLGEGRTIAEILARMKEDVSAVDEGRVFVGKRRVDSATSAVHPGDEVHVGPPPKGLRAAIQILFDGEGLLACIKPAGIPTVPDHAGSAHALTAIVARQTSRSIDDLRITSRLDREVSGVVVFATTEEAAERLRQAREQGTYDRRYVAIACGALEDEGTWDAPIGEGKDARHRSANGPNGKPSVTRWRVIRRSPRDIALALLAVEPVTGRTHQIRVHAAHAGAPLFGDRDYGGPSQVILPNGSVVASNRIALHCARVRALGHLFAAPIAEEVAATWRSFGGYEADLDVAVVESLSRPSSRAPSRR